MSDELFYERRDTPTEITLDLHTQKFDSWAKLPEPADLNVGLNRTHHTAVPWTDSIFIFGGRRFNDLTPQCSEQDGLNDMISFNIKDRTWRVVEPATRPPEPRYNHCAVVYQNSMIIFGGFSNRANKNDVHQFRFDRQLWTPWCHIRGDQPNPRSASCAFVYNHHMWVFGGYDGRNKLNDMWMLGLNEENPTWREVEQKGQVPAPVLHAVCAVINDRLFTFSGLSGASVSNDISCFNLTTETWSVIIPDLMNNSYTTPERRRGHTMVSYEKCLYIFGGQTTSRCSNDLYCFDTDSSTWSIVKHRNKLVTKNVPSNRYYHAAIIIDNTMFISGGIPSGGASKGGTSEQKEPENFYCFTFASLPNSTLRKDLSDLLEERRMCDLEFVVGEGPGEGVLQAHAAIVSARSPILKTRIEDALNALITERGLTDAPGSLLRALRPGEKVTLHFPKMPLTAFRIALQFVYTDRIPPSVREDGNSLVTLTDVYGIASHFQLSRLEKICINYIQHYLSTENVLSALTVAKERNLVQLVAVLEGFIVREQNFPAVLALEEFEWLDKTSILRLVRLKMGTVESLPFTAAAVAGTQATLEEDLLALLSDTSLTDVTLVVGGVRHPAHRPILVARCEYFSAMYRSLPPHNDAVTISIGELEPTQDAFASLLRYIYCNDTDIPPEDTLYLITADKFYGFRNKQLQAYCKKSLETNIKTSNVVEILKAADQVGSSDMKEHALKMIAEHITAVQPTPSFKSLSRNLLLDVFEYLVQHLKTRQTALPRSPHKQTARF